ncbi:MAG: TadE/TadG family type IV pilus assembly protein [Actinomycetota bacterium]
MQRLRRRLRGDRGSVAVEFAIILPVFLILVYGGLSFGLAMSAKSIVTEAAADGARAAIGQSTAVAQGQTYSAAELVAQNEAEQVLNNEGTGYKTYAVVTPTQSIAGDGTCGSSLSAVCVTVSISFPYSAHPAIPNAPGLGLVLPTNVNAAYTVEVTP